MSVICLFVERVYMCSPSCPEIHSVDQAGLELRDPPACLPVLGLKACATMSGKTLILKHYLIPVK